MNTIALKERSAELAPASESASIMEVISRAASDPATDVTKLERLMDLYERVERRQSEQAFNEAMNEAQTEIRPIAADASNPQTRSKYASYLALDKALRPIYTRHGFSLSFDTGHDAPESYVRVVCYVAHKEGHSRNYHVDMPADGKGAKGGDVMTKTHATGSAMTYGQRYLLKMIFNIAVGEDDDGNGADDTNAAVSETKAQTIRDMLERSGGDIEKFCNYFNIGSIPELKAKDFERAVVAINLRDKKAGAK